VTDISMAAGLLLRHIAQAVDLRPYAWTDLPRSAGYDAVTATQELVHEGFIAPYAQGWRLTEAGITYYHAVQESNLGEALLVARLKQRGLSRDQSAEVMHAWAESVRGARKVE
jgi:hypothetical protein